MDRLMGMHDCQNAKSEAHSPGNSQNKKHACLNSEGEKHAPENSQNKKHACQKSKGKNHAPEKSEGGDIFAPTFKYTATVSLLVTMLIGHFMVFDAMIQNGHIVWHMVVLHYIVPVMALLDWLLFDEKGRMPVWGPLAWISLAVGYLAFTMIAVGVFGIYMGGGTTADLTPYPYVFLDPAIVGAGAVIGFCAAMLAGFIALGYIMYGIDRLMASLSRHSGKRSRP